MSDFDFSAQNSRLTAATFKRDLDMVFGQTNLRGSAIRPPVAAIPSESVTTLEQVLAAELGCNGAVRLTPCHGGAKAEIDFSEQNIEIVSGM